MLVALALAASGCNGCGRSEKPASAQGTLPPLSAPGAMTVLPVAGFGDAVVSVPVGATRALPVVVAVLGIGDTPEEQCEAWRDIVGTRAFVLCPRGAKHFILDEEDAGAPSALAPPPPPPPPVEPAPPPPPVQENTPPSEPSAAPAPKEFRSRDVMMQPRAAAPEPRQVGFYPVDVPTLDREVLAALAALKQRFNTHVAETNLVYAGFSRGAFLGASLVAKHPDKFGRAILIEGGQSAWTAESALSFARSGGKRVLFACGTPSCLDESASAANLLRAQRMETRVINGAGEGHGYKKQVKAELKKSFAWVVEGDPLW